MNTILFRGKRKDNGEWVEGFYYEHEPPLQCFTTKGQEQEKSKSYILKTGFADWNMPRQVDFIEVIPETVGQFTGKCDMYGTNIFEGDIILWKDWKGVIRKADVRYDAEWNRFCVWYNGAESAGVNKHLSADIEIVGNIHDNPGLLEGKP